MYHENLELDYFTARKTHHSTKKSQSFTPPLAVRPSGQFSEPVQTIQTI